MNEETQPSRSLAAHGAASPGATGDKKTLVLVDGSSYLYRAFHAMPDLRAVPGDPTSPATGAIRGMINMMQALRKEVTADYAVCVFDASGPTFRDALYTEYKATRSPMPDDLRSQIEPIHQVVDLLGWKVVAVPGVEADDVIATLAHTAAAQGIEVIVSSGDKDLSQLVNEHITIIDTMSGKRRDVAGVTAEFGVPPALMVDYQALVGDTVDNVPGVIKVGPKTAAKWLEEYGSLDNLIANADAIKGVAGRVARHGPQVGHGMEGAVEVAGAVHQHQGLFVSHARIVHTNRQPPQALASGAGPESRQNNVPHGAGTSPPAAAAVQRTKVNHEKNAGIAAQRGVHPGGG